MAKVASFVTLSNKVLAKALLDKNTPRYANEDKWGPYSYEDVIYPQARFAFPEYNRLYPTNEEFTKYFARDVYRKDSKLLEIINPKEGGEEGPATKEDVLETIPENIGATEGVKEAAGPSEISTPSVRGLPPSLGQQKPNTPAEGGETLAEKQAGEVAAKAWKESEPTQKQTPIPQSFIKAFETPQVPYALTNVAKNAGSSGGIFIKRFGNRLGSSIFGLFGGIGKSGGSILGGFAGGGGRMLGGIAGAGGRLGGLGLRGIDTAVSISNQISTSSLIKGPSKKIWLLLLGGSVLISLGIGLFGAVTQPGQQPPPSTQIGLDYTLPLRDPSILPLDIKSQVLANFSGAKLDYWDDPIIRRSIEASWNPALVIALWIEETGASHTTLIANGGSEIPVNGRVSKGHLGCAPSEDQTIDESLDCLFRNFDRFSNDQFPQFMATYSGGPASNPFANNPNFPKNLKDWYVRLVPSGPGAIVPITPTPPPPISGVASCPVIGGTISTPSYAGGRISGRNNGHCDPLSYGYTCNCGTSGRRAKAIDVPTNGQDVVLPKINGQDVLWTMVIAPYTVDSGEGGGVGYTFKATLGSDTWYLDALHLQPSTLRMRENYISGTPIAKTAISHVHMTIGKNLSSSPEAGSSTDCDSGWIPSDFMCQ